MAKGFWFMPLSLVRLRTFRLSTCYLGANIDAGVNAGARVKVSLRDVTIVNGELKERELNTRRQTRRIDFWSSETRGELVS